MLSPTSTVARPAAYPCARPCLATPSTLGTHVQQLEALGPTGPWTDVHALALLLVEVALGRHPFEHLSVSDIIDRLLDPLRPTPRQVGLVVSDAVEAVMERALAVDPQQRPADAGAFWRALTI